MTAQSPAQHTAGNTIGSVNWNEVADDRDLEVWAVAPMVRLAPRPHAAARVALAPHRRTPTINRPNILPIRQPAPVALPPHHQQPKGALNDHYYRAAR